jgi:polar amino acid transport system substrate-binding protein
MKNKLLILIFILCTNSVFASEIELTQEEREYLKKKTEIKMCVDPNWMPLEKIDKDGKYIGILSEYIKLFSSRLDVKFSLQKTTTYAQSRKYLKSGRCDIIVADVATKLVKEQFLVTKPYFIMPRAFAINSDTKGVQNFSQIALEGKIGVLLNAPAESILKNIYTDIEIVAFSDMPKGLNAVATKQIIAYVGAMSPMAYSIQNNGLLNVNIGGTVNKDKLSVLINKNSPQLVSILDKAIDNLSENDKIEILNKWVKVTYKKSVDYTLVWQITIVFVLLSLVGLFFTFLLRKKNKKLKQIQEQSTYIYGTAVKIDRDGRDAQQYCTSVEAAS